jgi:hypothetical protein
LAKDRVLKFPAAEPRPSGALPPAVTSTPSATGTDTTSSGLFDGSVDVVDREALKFYIAPAATADTICAF